MTDVQTRGAMESAFGMSRKVRHGLKSMAFKLAVTKATGFVVKLVLARLLVPEMFGLVAMVTVVVGFLAVFSDLGMSSALIQRRREAISPLRYDSAFWFLAIAGGIMAALVWLLGVPFMVWFYEEPRLAPIAFALAFGLWLGTLGMIPRVRLTRLMRFGAIVRADVIAMLSGAACAVALALIGAGLWALVAQKLVTSFVTLVALWLSTPWRPRFRFKLATLIDVVGFSGFTLANSILYFLRKNMDVIVVGKILGATSLGIYSIAFALTEVLRMQLYQVVNKVLFPAYSRMQDEPEAMKPFYLATIKYMALIVWPISTMIILYADPMIPIFFGENWAEAIQPARILALASMMFALTGSSAELLRALGKVKLQFQINVAATLVVALPAIIIGTAYGGLNGAAFAVLFHYTVHRTVIDHYARGFVKVGRIEALISLWPAAGVSIGIVLVSLGIDLLP